MLKDSMGPEIDELDVIMLHENHAHISQAPLYNAV